MTHNYRDFSEPAGNQKHPHPDFAALFSARKSRYYINIGDVLSTMHLKGASAWMLETYDQPIRRMSDILDAIDELVTKVW